MTTKKFPTSVVVPMRIAVPWFLLRFLWGSPLVAGFLQESSYHRHNHGVIQRSQQQQQRQGIFYGRFSCKLSASSSVDNMNDNSLISSQSDGRTRNGDEDEYNNGVGSSVRLSPYEALENFLSVVADYNNKKQYPTEKSSSRIIRIVPQGLSQKQLPELCQEVQTNVFVSDDDDSTTIIHTVIAADDDGKNPAKLDIAKVEAAVLSIEEENKTVRLVTGPDELLSLNSFPSQNYPPPICNNNLSSNKTIVIMDSDLVENCCQTTNEATGDSSDMFLMFGGGHAYWRTILSYNALTDCLAQNNYRLHVASIIQEDTDDGDDDDTSDVLPPSRSRLSYSVINSNHPTTDDPVLLPIEAIEVPPCHISKIVVQQRELSNPLIPSFVTATGKIGKIHSKRKQQIQCELLPIVTEEKNRHESKIDSNGTSSSLCGGWKSKDGIDMGIDLIVGKKFVQQLGKIQAIEAIDNLKEGMEIQIQGKTTVENRDSLTKWIDTQTLDLEVIDYQIFTSRKEDSAGGCDDATDASATVSKTEDKKSNAIPTKRHKHRPPSNIATTSPGMPELTMDDLFSNGSIHFVDDLDSLHQFEADFEKFLVQIGEDLTSAHEVDSANRLQSIESNIVGIDCEWQPSQFDDNPHGRRQPQPVLLMQVSLQALEQVYIFDFQTMLRPLLSPGTPMDEIENEVCQILQKVFSSTKVFKVGYQISSDLKRIAASYPHMYCFQEAHSVLEVSSVIKRILHVTKQKKSRLITQSLARMTEHYIRRTLNKECQISNWALRPIDSKQVHYAALDAAISPKLIQSALESIDAKVCVKIPQLMRFDGDDSLSKLIESWRFVVFLEDSSSSTADGVGSDNMDNDVVDLFIQKFKAKRIIGPAWAVSQNWITGRKPPESITLEDAV